MVVLLELRRKGTPVFKVPSSGRSAAEIPLIQTKDVGDVLQGSGFPSDSLLSSTRW